MVVRALARLPVVDALVERVLSSGHSSSTWDGVLVVANQHLVPSFCSLVSGLLRMGLRPANLICTGKAYSARKPILDWLRAQGVAVVPPDLSTMRFGQVSKRHQRDLERLWRRVYRIVQARRPDRVVLMDDGGFALRTMPQVIAEMTAVHAIEQTSSGLRFGSPRPGVHQINLAASAAKRILESPFIASAVARGVAESIARYHPKTNQPIGVAGVGNVGLALVSHYAKVRQPVVAFDVRGEAVSLPSGVRRVGSLRELCESCRIVIGCTGQDVFSGAEWLGELGHDLTLFSASSQDFEFQSLLALVPRARVRVGADAHLEIGNARIRIPFAGFPINFQCTGEREAPEEIQLTRALMLGAVVQSVALTGIVRRTDDWREPDKLDDALQRLVVRLWTTAQPIDDRTMAKFESMEWIRENSAGIARRAQNASGLFG